MILQQNSRKTSDMQLYQMLVKWLNVVTDHNTMTAFIMPPPLGKGALSVDACLTSVCL